jgi:methylated-DNA-[protein]-cysteine S-methyltransferase
MKFINIQYCKTKIGELILGSFEGKLCLLDFRYRKMRKTVDERIKKGLNAKFAENNTEIIEKTLSELRVPFGTTSTYLQLAKNIKNEKAVRAVASANGANSMSIIIPCHRIIGSNGKLVGYAGGLPIKKQLLKLEQITTQSGTK